MRKLIIHIQWNNEKENVTHSVLSKEEHSKIISKVASKTLVNSDFKKIGKKTKTIYFKTSVKEKQINQYY